MAVSNVDLQRYLKGMDYPSNKDGLIQKASENQAPRDVLDLLGNLPDWEFKSVADVSKAAGEAY